MSDTWCTLTSKEVPNKHSWWLLLTLTWRKVEGFNGGDRYCHCSCNTLVTWSLPTATCSYSPLPGGHRGSEVVPFLRVIRLLLTFKSTLVVFSVSFGLDWTPITHSSVSNSGFVKCITSLFYQWNDFAFLFGWLEFILKIISGILKTKQKDHFFLFFDSSTEFQRVILKLSITLQEITLPNRMNSHWRWWFLINGN